MKPSALLFLLLLAAGQEPELLFEPPPAGSYELPVIARVAEHRLLDAEGDESKLPGLERGQVALIAFVYRGCSDAEGCPLALATLRRLDRELARRPALEGRARLVTVSFDPAHDTPERMAELRRAQEPRGDWRFLTAASPEALAPLLADYGQDVTPEMDGSLLRHVLKIFLVDEDRGVRNIYSAGFMSWQIVLNDIETVLRLFEDPYE